MRPLAFAALMAAVLASPSGASTSAVAQDGSPHDTLVTEEEFLAAVDGIHPAFAVLREATGLAQAEVVEARTLADPTLDIAREDPTGAAEQLEVAVAWQLPRPARRRLLVAAAEQGADATRFAASRERLRVRQNLRRIFATWATAGARAERLRLHAEHVAGLAARERLRAQHGEASGMNARRLDLAAAEVRGRLAIAEAEVLQAQGEARGFVSDLPTGGVAALPAIPAIPAARSIPALENPHLATLTAELEAARLARHAADLVANWPRLVAGWQRQEEADGSADGPVLGLSWTLPVVRRERAARGRTQTRLEAAEARLELARRQSKATRRGALSAYAHLASAARTAAEATAENTHLTEAATAAFRYGELGLTDLLDTLRSTLDSELAALELHTAALAAHRDLEAAVGRALAPSNTPNTTTH